VRRVALLSLALVALFAVTGCGSTETTNPQFVPAAQVIRQFERETGRPLQRAAMEDEAFDQLSYGLNPSKDLLAKYGIFAVYVAKPGHPAAAASLLHDKTTKKPLQRDPHGVYWELDPTSGTWVAYKRYVQNVVLVWFTGSKTSHDVDARFERLDRVLRGLRG
jgi:hypothetical protein